MKRKIKYFIQITLIAMLFWNCSSNKKDAVELNTNRQNQLNLENTYKVVELEKRNESLLTYIDKTIIDETNDRIFVLSDFNIYIFTEKGNFLTRLKIGRGPGEINRIISFATNAKTKTIYAIDDAYKLCAFDYNGSMINNYDIKDFCSFDVAVLDDDNILLLRNSVGISEKFFVGIYNLTTKKIVKKFISADESPYSQNSVITANNFSQNNGKIYLCLTNVIGLFEYRDHDFHKILTFDIGEKAVPKRISDKFGKEGQCNLREESKSRHFVAFTLFSFCLKGYYFAVIDDDEFNCYAISQENNTIYHNGTLPSYFGLPNYKSLRLLSGIQDNTIIFQCSPLDFYESKEETGSKEIIIANHKILVNKDDNPFLIIVK